MKTETTSNSTLFEPIKLRNGQILRNRIAKAAMEENLAAYGQIPDKHLITLYRKWGQGGAGLLITGNVMVHAEALTGPAGVVLDDKSPIEPFKEWAKAGKADGASMWMQINHPGRQVQSDMPGVVWGPSDIGVDLGKHTKRYGKPTAMTAEQIEETVVRFATTAKRAELAGFDGVEIHAAHGYLLSQFLSPLVNKRTDQWGGSLENRARILLDVVRAVRSSVSPEFAVAVKLNSADFQRGGFQVDDARKVIEMLAPLGVDLIEISGGSYESPAMSGRPKDDHTASREAYFLELAEELATTSPLPLMLTGGITHQGTAERVLASNVAIVGLATAHSVNPDLAKNWKKGVDADKRLKPINWSDKQLASLASMALVRFQLKRLAKGKNPIPSISPRITLVIDQIDKKRALGRYSNWLSTRTNKNI